MPKDDRLDELESMTDEQFNEQEELLGRSLHLIPSVEANVDIDKVDFHDKGSKDSWQPRMTTDAARLFNSICVTGIANRMRVHLVKGVYHALDGRHRWASLLKIHEERPEVWKRHEFDKGCPCIVYEDLTSEQVLAIRTDEGRIQEPLANKVEAFNALLPHYEALVEDGKGNQVPKKDAAIESEHWRIFADCCVSSSKRGELYHKFSTMTDPKDFLVAIHNATRNAQQLFRRLYECPNFVRKYWASTEATGLFEGKAADKLTQGEITKLAHCHLAEVAEDVTEDSEAPLNRSNPGAAVQQMFQDILADKKTKRKSESKETPMSPGERETHIQNPIARCEKTIFAAVNGNPAAKQALKPMFESIARYESAHRIDSHLIEELILVLVRRDAAVPDKVRQQIYTLIKDAPKPEAKEPSMAKPKSGKRATSKTT